MNKPSDQRDNQIKGIIFDIGYTLIEYRDGSWPQARDRGFRQAYQLLRDEHDYLPLYYEFIECFEIIKEEHRLKAAETLAGWRAYDVINDLLIELAIIPEKNLIVRMLEAIYSPSRDIMYAGDETVSTVRKLKEAGFGLGIISNTIFPPSCHETDLIMLGFMPYFDFAIYSSESEHRKPHQSIFEAGAKRAGASANEIIYVGDRYDSDVLGSQAVGMHPILKYCERQKYPEPMPSNIHVVNRLDELLGLLDGNVLTQI